MKRNRTSLLVILGLFLCCSSVLSAQWEFLGLSGRHIETLRLHGDFLYVATDDGIYRKEVGAADTVWTPVGLQGKNVGSLLIANLDTILAGVRISGVGSDTVSLFRTANGGAEWHPYQNRFGGGGIYNQVEVLEGLPHQPDTLFAAAYGRDVVAKSTDGGLSWRVVWGEWDSPGIGTNFLKIDPVMPNIVWAGGESIGFEPYILKSVDSGENWEQVWTDFVGDNAGLAIAIDPSNSDVVYVVMEGWITKTTNGGGSWNTVFSPEDYHCCWGVGISTLVPSHVYTTGRLRTGKPHGLVLFDTDDGGNSWHPLVEDTLGTGATDLQIVSNSETDKVYIGTKENGVYQYTNIVTDIDVGRENQLPMSYELRQNYPNPFNSTTTIEFTLPHSGFTVLEIFTIRGEKIATIFKGELPAGRHRVQWNGSKSASAVYICILRTPRLTRTRKLILLR